MVGVRLEPDFRAEIEEWAETQDDRPVLAEAIRRLIRRGLDTLKRRKPAPAAPASASKPAPRTKAAPSKKARIRR
jgi:hypothetical protein